MEELQFGLIGCGNMGSSLATAAQALDHTEVSCVCVTRTKREVGRWQKIWTPVLSPTLESWFKDL